MGGRCGGAVGVGQGRERWYVGREVGEDDYDVSC